MIESREKLIDKIVLDIAPIVMRFQYPHSAGLTPKGLDVLAREGISFFSPAELETLRAIAKAALQSIGYLEATPVATLPGLNVANPAANAAAPAVPNFINVKL